MDSGVELLGHERTFFWYLAWFLYHLQHVYIEATLSAGGDDLKMKGWDVRQGFDCPIFENRR